MKWKCFALELLETDTQDQLGMSRFLSHMATVQLVLDRFMQWSSLDLNISKNSSADSFRKAFCLISRPLARRDQWRKLI